MRRTLAASAAIGLMLAPLPVLAAPPADSMPMSKILQGIEERADFAFIKEVDWDDDGHYDIEYVTKDGAQVEIEVSPRTGEALPRR